jgi:predicted CoA-substrate-specific enzyme activase
MLYAGIDIGSVSTDAVLISDEGTIQAWYVVPTGPSFVNAAKTVLENVMRDAGCRREDIRGVVGTGYGRKKVGEGSGVATEIRCHAQGAHFLNNEVRTIVDIGGQDCKVIALNERGDVIDFAMNDKCSAGTGRFVDVIARALEVPLDQMGPLSLQSTQPAKISAVCTVFAETEVISKLADEVPRMDIVKGIHLSIAERIKSLLQRVQHTAAYAITGGGGKNIGIVRALEECLGVNLVTYQNPQIIGALGAALEARQQFGSLSRGALSASRETRQQFGSPSNA